MSREKIAVHTLTSKYHSAMEQWQNSHFKDLNILKKYWAKYFPGEPEFELCAITQTLTQSQITQGKYAGLAKFSQAKEMRGSMLYQALRIIKAQCSTELGSIQQHADTVDSAPSEYAKFSILRIMAEEFRHAYQMFWVLSHDSSWSSTGDNKISDNIMDELLAMNTGNHVLDAFNIHFSDCLDNIIFACFIDRVGKFQLTMQQEFAYAPMAASMRPMLVEEAFHLKTGWTVLKELAINSALGNGPYTLELIQRKFNLWFPHALDMFGNTDGGESNIQFSFKTCSNQEGQQGYIRELLGLMRQLNAAIISAQNPGCSRDIVQTIAHESPLLTLPHPTFLRRRDLSQAGSNKVRFFDIQGNKVDKDKYPEYLFSVLPDSFLSSECGKLYAQKFIS